MNTGRISQIVSTSSDVTERLGEQLGSRCRGGEVIELVGDLGSGKTTLVRGLARGLGSSELVSSPTYKISNIYSAGKLELHHFDFYRLDEAGMIAGELADTIGQPDVIIVIEWGGIVEDILPEEKLTVRLETSGESERKLTLVFPEAMAHLVEGVSEL